MCSIGGTYIQCYIKIVFLNSQKIYTLLILTYRWESERFRGFSLIKFILNRDKEIDREGGDRPVAFTVCEASLPPCRWETGLNPRPWALMYLCYQVCLSLVCAFY